jgi:threonine aldolase
VHLDGARIFNAIAKLEIDPKLIGTICDSITFCLSKGLCAPVGSVVCGNKQFIFKARENRKLLGGGMR